MSDVKPAEARCPFCKQYLEQGDAKGLAKHLERHCNSITRDGTKAELRISVCPPFIVDQAPGGGGLGIWVFVGNGDASQGCLYTYVGSPS